MGATRHPRCATSPSALPSRAALAEQEALLAAHRRFTRPMRSEDEVWQAVAEAALDVVRAAHGASVALPEGDDLVCHGAAGSIEAGTRFRRNPSLSGRCLEEGRPLLMADGFNDPRANTAINRAKGIRSAIAVPFPLRGRFVGVLRLISPKADAFTERDSALAQILAGIIGTGLSSLGEQRALMAARESDAKQQLMADAVPHILWQADAEGRVDFLNRRWAEVTGIPADHALQAQPWLELLHPEDRQAVADAWMAASRKGCEFRVTYRQRDAKGCFRWMVNIGLPYREPGTGRITRWFGSTVDVHDEMQGREQVRRLNAELERVVAERTLERDQIWMSSTDLLCVASVQGQMLALNPAWTRTLGWPVESLIDQPFMDYVHSEDHERTSQAMEGLRRGQAQFHFVNRYRHQDGSWRWLSWNANPVEERIFATARDITAEKDHEELLQQLEDQLRQSQKMEAVGQLTGGLAHDFNNLLTGVIGSLDLLEARLQRGRLEDLDRFILAARGAAERAASLTHRLMAFSRRQTLDPRPVRADELVLGMEELVRRTVGPGIRVEVARGDAPWGTLCDPNQLENALLNLCINARDAMPQGGRLRISTANLSLEGRGAQLVRLTPGDYVVMRVADTGTGMPPEVLARAFDPFFTTKPIGQGTGLGLSMVYGFARQSGGEVSIESRPGQGTAISLFLPRHDVDRADVTVPAPVPVLEPAPGPFSVLVVDDEPTVRLLAREVLQEMGCSVDEASEAGAAFAMLQSGRAFDLLVTDVGLPGGMNGRQLADAARVLQPELKILFITGYAEEAALREGSLGRDMEILAKPFNVEALHRRLSALLEAEDR
ncbi:PAS domain-containing protein [Pseudoroseomonas globiformis]|uniref:histidine kinase n=1 Tax=Teichococcus globiformis TaxID=2307229 RepID=A0ABV7FZ43_9PROT